MSHSKRKLTLSAPREADDRALKKQKVGCCAAIVDVQTSVRGNMRRGKGRSKKRPGTTTDARLDIAHLCTSEEHLPS